MMAILNRNQELPRDRPELYNQASRVLLHQWDVERALIEDPRLDPKTIDYKDKQAMLRQVAYYMQADEAGLNANLIAAKNLEDILTGYLKTIETSQARSVARLMSNQLRIRNFILCFVGADYYAFVHRTFLEYFCAWEFVWQFKEEQTLSIEQLISEVFGQHWHDESWHEVLRLIAGMIQPLFAKDIILFLMDQDGKNQEFVNLFLAASLLGEVRNRSTISEISNKLLDKFKQIIINREAERDTCIKAIDIISNIWKNDLQALLFLKELPCSKAFMLEPSVEILALARISRESEQAFICLQDLAESGNETAIIELVKITGDNPQTLTLIQDLAESGNETAMAEFIKIAGDHPQALPIIKSIVRTSRNKVLKSTAIEALFRYWKQDPDTIFLIKKAAQSGDNAAIRELVTNFREDPQVLSIVRDLALAGDAVAIEELAYYWQNEPKTLSILQKLAINGNEAAAIELALGWSTDRRTLFILTEAEIYYNREDYRDRYYFNQNQNDDVQIILRTLTQFKNKKNDKRIDVERWLPRLASHNDIMNIQDDLQELKREKKAIDIGHYSTLITKIKDAECLVNALHSIGMTVKTNYDVRGSNKQRIRADVVAVLEGDFDLGWSEGIDGSFDLIVDIWGVTSKNNQPELINSINRRYAAMESGYERFAS